MAKARRISLLDMAGMPGRLHLSPCPGSFAGEASRDAVAGDLATIAASGATLLVTLVEAGELPLGLAGWRAAVDAAGLGFLHLPIPDFGVPDAGFEAAWAAAGLAHRLAAGETIALHCRAGLGRTGTIAARLLIECDGLTPTAAIARIRAEHDGRAVETEAQVAHLAAVAESRRSPE